MQGKWRKRISYRRSGGKDGDWWMQKTSKQKHKTDDKNEIKKDLEGKCRVTRDQINLIVYCCGLEKKRKRTQGNAWILLIFWLFGFDVWKRRSRTKSQRNHLQESSNWSLLITGMEEIASTIKFRVICDMLKEIKNADSRINKQTIIDQYYRSFRKHRLKFCRQLHPSSSETKVSKQFLSIVDVGLVVLYPLSATTIQGFRSEQCLLCAALSDTELWSFAASLWPPNSHPG